MADDGGVNQEVRLALLDDVGPNADVAAGGPEALALARSGDCGMAPMDMQMHLVGGVEATREIRERSDCRHRPIIVFTANAFDGDRQACRVIGLDDFITEPVEPAILESRGRRGSG